MQVSLEQISRKIEQEYKNRLVDNRLSLIQVKSRLSVYYKGADGREYHMVGICISKKNNNCNSSFTMLAIDDTINYRVEITFPLYSPGILVLDPSIKEINKKGVKERINIAQQANSENKFNLTPAPKKTTRSKLYFLRTKYGKEAKRYLR